MVERLKSVLAEGSLIPAGTRVLVGYSGGADSTCLLHLLRLCGVDIVAAHLHHGQREEADTELKLCEAFCDGIGVPFVSGRANVPQMARAMKVGLEEAGRHARYEFFGQAASALHCGLVVTAHTMDDHVETVLLNLARGAGMAGLGGVPVRSRNIVRPLLSFTRKETRRYCDENALWYHDDPANSDVSFSRARVRHRIVPELEAINPAVRVAIARLAAVAAEEDDFLNAASAAALERAERRPNGVLAFLTIDCEAWFSRDDLRHLPRVLLNRGMRLAAAVLGASLDFAQTEAICSGLMGQGKGSVTAEGGSVVAEWNLTTVAVRKLTGFEPYRSNLTIPGETISDEFGWSFVVHETDPMKYERPRSALEVVLDASSVKGQLFFRTAKQGDDICPLNMAGSKKIADIFSDAKLTEAARKRMPLVCDMLGPVWAPGLVLADRTKVTPSTTRGLLLRLEPQVGQESHNKETASNNRT